ncbi:chemotaxis protein CheA [Halocella sp. SP3-1]|nr:chemotaxis protein CheA [Halocella sp. SP3-1]
MVDDELLRTFVEESEELLVELEQNLLALEKDPDNDELLKEVFRLVHTIKGSSGLAGCENITNFVHLAEDLLEQIRNGLLRVDDKTLEVLFNTHDIISDMLQALVFADYQVNSESLTLTKNKLKAFSNETINQPSNSIDNSEVRSSKFYKIKMEFSTGLFKTGTAPLLLLKELDRLGDIIEVYLDLTRIPDFFEIKPEECYLTIELIIKGNISLEDLEDIFVFVEIDNKIKIEDIRDEYQRGTGKNPNDKAVKQRQQCKDLRGKNTIKVATEKLELLMNSVAELLISQAQVKERVFHKGLHSDQDLEVSLNNVDKRIRNLQEEFMKIRMVPIGDTFLRFRRLVRDLSREQNKRVKLIIKGKDTELDKTIIEKISDPLKHMLRNAVDHGIETPEERSQLGKPAEGSITLDAYQREGYIIIEISDDGRGLNKEKIRKSAVKRGIIYEDDPLAGEDIYNLIFEPGLSTSESVTETSGRGVGMDVVRNEIEALRGSIVISTSKDQGTSYKIKLPLTLAIIDGMSIMIGSECFIIPINAIMEFYQPAEDEIKTVTGKGESVRIRGEYLNLFRLGKLFNIRGGVEDPTEGILIILKDDGKKIGLLVDEILGQEQAVVKSLEDNYVNIQGFAGATILGDGSVAMIIDVSSLIKSAFR